MPHITSNLLGSSSIDKAIIWFCKFIICKQNNSKIDFYSGYMNETEGYKREIFNNAHKALKLETWAENDIGTSKILNHVIEALNAKDNKGFNNIIDYHGITHIKTKSLEDILCAEDILYRLFCSDDVESAFNDACSFFGRRYPELSYMLFIRDCTRYLPIKNSDKNHVARFKKLGFPTDCLQSCTWENFNDYLEIHQLVREKLENSFNCEVSLLDAHSFIWIINNAPPDFIGPDIGDNTEGVTFLQRVVGSIDYEANSSVNAHHLNEIINRPDLEGGEREQLIKSRINQSVFRNRLLLRYDKCCLCGVQNKAFLCASHIKPWKDSLPKEQVDADNGFLLCPNHDKLFDEGWISFSDEGKIMISDDLSQTDRIFLNVTSSMSISLVSGNIKYLRYHRNNIYRGKTHFEK